MAKGTLVVVNPRSGGGKTGRLWPELKGPLERALGPVEVAFTEAQGHGAELAEQGARAGHRLVVALGGDGTLSEVCAGLWAAKQASHEAEVGLIGQGTGGDFRKSLGLEHRLDKYLEALASGRTRPLDLGLATRFAGTPRATVRPFVNILSAGIGGLVDRYVADASRTFGGTAAYLGASVKSLLSARLGHVTLSVTNDGATTEHRLRTFMIAFCNGQYFGSGMHVAPMARLDDGVLEVVAIGETSKFGFALASSGIHKAKHLTSPTTRCFRGQAFELRLENDDARDVFLLDVDGEPLDGVPLRVELAKAALTLRA